LTVDDEGLIESDSPETLAYTPRRLVRDSVKKANAPAATPKAKAPRSVKAPVVEVGSDYDPDADLQFDGGGQGEEIPDSRVMIEKARGELQYRAVLRKLAEVRLMALKKELVPRSLFVAAVQGINKAVDDHLHRLPAKLGPVLYALARRDGSTELEVIRTLETEMGGAIRRAVEDVARLQP
jgi:hypothetical protein